MPNWCENRITISGDDLSEIRKKIFTEDGFMTFNLLIPMPAILQKTRSGSREFDGTIHKVWTFDGTEDGSEKERPLTDEEAAEVAATGYTSWYDWSIANWGTKWNVNPSSVHLEDDDPQYIRILFDTAWSPPQPWVLALREAFPDVRISAFYDEPMVEAGGYY